MKGAIILLLLIAGAVIGGYFFVKSFWHDTYTISGTVLNKHEKTVGDSESTTTYYMITLTDGTVLEVDRNWFYLSPETQQDRVFGLIKEDHTYNFTCWGWRLEVLWIAWYPKIIGAEEI